MRGVAIIPNWQKENTTEVVDKLRSFFEVAGIPVFLMKDENNNRDKSLSAKISSWRDQVELIIVAGGDGTILRVARDLASWQLPILGINIGHKGFLAELEVQDIPSYLQQVLDGKYSLSKRIMLKAVVKREEKEIASFTALNDMVVTKGPFSRIIRLDAFIGDEFLESYTGDGIIVATPTGSTGYSLSAGGPIVNPDLNILIVTPVCPHSLYNRSVIVDGSETIRLEVHTRQSEIALTVDGQVSLSLSEGDAVILSRSSMKAELISFKDRSFYKLLGSKLKE